MKNFICFIAIAISINVSSQKIGEHWDDYKNLKFNELTWLVGHNAFQSGNYFGTAPEFGGANQELSITEQLEYGVRGFELDIYRQTLVPETPATRSVSYIHISHGDLNASSMELLTGGVNYGYILDGDNVLTEMRDFLNAPGNEREIIILDIEAKDVNDKDLYITLLKKTIELAFGRNKIFNPQDFGISPNNQDHWPTLQEMISRGKRVVVFVQNIDVLPSNKDYLMNTNNYQRKTDYNKNPSEQMEIMTNLTPEYRGGFDRGSLHYISFFHTPNLHSTGNSGASKNLNTIMDQGVLARWLTTRKKPTLVALDFLERNHYTDNPILRGIDGFNDGPIGMINYLNAPLHNLGISQSPLPGYASFFTAYLKAMHSDQRLERLTEGSGSVPGLFSEEGDLYTAKRAIEKRYSRPLNEIIGFHNIIYQRQSVHYERPDGSLISDGPDVSKTVDGDTENTTTQILCEANNWSVTLDGPAVVDGLTIQSGNSCSESFNFTVVLSEQNLDEYNTLDELSSLDPESGKYEAIRFTTSVAPESFIYAPSKSFSELGIYPRFIKIYFDEEGSSLTEVQVFGTYNILPYPSPISRNLAYQQPTRQSTDHYPDGGGSHLAVDGNTNGNFRSHRSVTHTSGELFPWWEVDLEQQAEIDEIKIYNRTDCCSGRLSDFYVFISPEPFGDRSISEIINSNLINDYETVKIHYQSPVDDVVSFDLSAYISNIARGRYVRIQLAGTNYLSLAEVQVYGRFITPPIIDKTNLALNKPASQSDTYESPTNGLRLATIATDGNTLGGDEQYVTHTSWATKPWWEVNLGRVAEIDEIKIYNRTDCCSDRLSNFKVFVSNNSMEARTFEELSNDPDVTSISFSEGAGIVSFTHVFPNSIRGQYVKVQLAGANFLSLAEVEVYGRFITPPIIDKTNLALNKPASQSKTYGGNNGGYRWATIATDGNRVGDEESKVTHTDDDPNSWWQVNLGQEAEIDEIIIYNRTDCCSERLSNFKVFVSNNSMEARTFEELSNDPDVTSISFSEGAGIVSFTHVFPNSIRGQYVKVQLAGANFLSLAEVEVYGRFITPIIDNSNLALNKPASQSSTYGGRTATIATDGNRVGDEESKVTHTNGDPNSWWQVNLGQEAEIDEIKIYNRTDCCSDRLSNFKVFVSNNSMEALTFDELSNDPDVTSISFSTGVGSTPFTHVFPNSIRGQYVKVQLAGANYLSLAEVEVYGRFIGPPIIDNSNLALYKPASQSSTYESPTNGFRWANIATDGNRVGDEESKVTHTNGDPNSWWQVNLGQVAEIDEIKIYNRTDCCSDRLSNFKVFVSNNSMAARNFEELSNDPDVTSISFSTGVGSTPFTHVFPNSIRGQYVKVQLAGANFLSLAEVEVYGRFFQPSGPLVNLALRKPARQISTLSNYGANLAVDGLTSNSSTSFNHTNREPEPFWEVDLGNQAQIEEVVVYNRTDISPETNNRISEFFMLISPNPFDQDRFSGYLGDGITTIYQHTGPITDVMTIPIETTGRYVRIQLFKDEFLHMAEVEVMGRFLSSSGSSSKGGVFVSEDLTEPEESIVNSKRSPTVSDQVHDYKLELFPNESSGEFSLSFNLKPEDSRVAVQIVDARGTVVYSGESIFEQRECVWKIREFGLSNGVYLVRVDFGGHLEVKRLIIKK